MKAVRTTVFRVRRDLKADFSDAAEYLALLQGALEFALFPHARPQRAEHFGTLNRMLARIWVASKIKTHVGDLNWLHADRLDSIAGAFPNAFALVGNCRFPLCVTADVAQEWFDSWMFINEQHVAGRG